MFKSADERIADLEAKLTVAERTIAIQQAEIDTLSAVIARDRERIKAETSAYVRQRAQNEASSG